MGRWGGGECKFTSAAAAALPLASAAPSPDCCCCCPRGGAEEPPSARGGPPILGLAALGTDAVPAGGGGAEPTGRPAPAKLSSDSALLQRQPMLLLPLERVFRLAGWGWGREQLVSGARAGREGRWNTGWWWMIWMGAVGVGADNGVGRGGGVGGRLEVGGGRWERCHRCGTTLLWTLKLGDAYSYSIIIGYFIFLGDVIHYLYI